MARKEIEFKVLRKNSYGHRFILEPKERIKFRERCKHNKLGTLCEKGYKCYTANNPRHVIDAVLIGCTPNVSCPRCRAWDKRHGLDLPYTMVENKYPDLKPTTFTWHPATESPGKRRVLMAMTRKDLGEGQYVFQSVRFCSPDVRPATCAFRDDEGRKQLPVAWAFYDEIIKAIAPWMISRAEDAAWAWWPEKESEDNIKE
jgi:hypothetical protein